MRAVLIPCATIAVLLGSVPNIVWAGSTGRRNTAIAATAVAAGAWTNGTGKAGTRNTAIAATAVAAGAWGAYSDKKKAESQRRSRRVVYKSRSAAGQKKKAVCVPAKQHRGKKLGHSIGRGHKKHHCKHHCRHAH